MNGFITITLSGIDEPTAVMQLLASGRAAQVIGQALYMEAQQIMGESQGVVPLRDGILRGSGHVDPPEYSSSGASVILGYGGAASAYALIQHENMSFHHPNGRVPKYLENPARAAGPRLEKRLSDALDQLFGK